MALIRFKSVPWWIEIDFNGRVCFIKSLHFGEIFLTAALADSHWVNVPMAGRLFVSTNLTQLFLKWHASSASH